MMLNKENLEEAIICDLHGCLLIKEQKKYRINTIIYDMISNLNQYKILLVTAKPGKLSQEREVLEDNFNEEDYLLFNHPAPLKKAKDWQIKDMINNERILGFYIPVLAIDNKKKCIKMWASYNVSTCLFKHLSQTI